MGYRLTQDESIPIGMRRVAREEIDSAVAQLGETDKAKADEAVHEARKSVKKLRGAIRLLMPGLGEAGERDNIALRDVGRALSDFRDAAALIETVDHLKARYPEDPSAAELPEVRAALVTLRDQAEKESNPEVAAANAVRTLRSFRRRLNRWDIGADGFSAIEPGLRATYRRGRKALERAQKDAIPENFHELRKRVKDRWYHTRLLEDLWANALGCPENDLKQLQEWLGDDHNLAMLRERVAAGSAVAALIARCQAELRENSLSLAAILYKEKPRVFARGVRHLWDAWPGRPQAMKELEAPPRKRAKPVTSARKTSRSAA
jgi:CHAD domain-containing protein